MKIPTTFLGLIGAIPRGNPGPAEHYRQTTRLLGAHHSRQNPFAYLGLVALLLKLTNSDQSPILPLSSPTSHASAFV